MKCVLFFVFLVQIRITWDKMHHIGFQINFHLKERKLKPLKYLIDIPILYLSSYIIENKHDYYRLLNQTNRLGEWEEWILFMLKAIEITSIQTIEKISEIRQLLDRTIEKVQVNAPKIYKKELEQIGILESQKVGRETLYINKELIEVLIK